jgi:hypothetical protein
MRPSLLLIPLLVATPSAGCTSTKFGREFANHILDDMTRLK